MRRWSSATAASPAPGRAVECTPPEDLPPVHVSGRWIIPGLIDGHVHYSQTGWADGRPDQAADLRDEYRYAAAMAENRAHPERYFRSYLCSGVTATWDVGGYPWTWDLRARAENDPLTPHVAAAGPLLSARDHWLNLPAERQFLYLSDAETVEAAVRYLLESGTDDLKVWYLVEEGSPDAEHYQQMIRIAGRLAGEANVPLIVHATGLWQAKDALHADVISRYRRTGEERYRIMLHNLRRVYEAGIPVVMGTDAGNTLTLHGPAVFAEMEAMQEAGLAPMDVLVASTLNAATAMGRDADLGSVEPGKVADLVILEADPTADIANMRSRSMILRAGWLHRVTDLRYR